MKQIKWKILLLLILVLSFAIYLCRVLFNSISCDSDRYTAEVCKLYEENSIAGTLCEELCHMRTLVFSHCTLDLHGYRIFHQEGFDIKVSNAVFASGKPVLKNYYTKPSLGVSTYEFHSMLNEFLVERLGRKNHSSFVKDLISFGDANRDGQLTLAEAKSLWAIIQQREFLMYFILRRRHSHLVPQFYGFCGDLVAVEPLAMREIFWRPVASSSVMYPVIDTLAGYGWYDAKTYARISLALVESATELFGDGSDALYVCNEVVLDIYRLDVKGNVRIANFMDLYSQHEIELHSSGKQCRSQADCIVPGPGCRVVCSQDTGRCVTPPPVLRRICEVLVPYLIPGATAEGLALSPTWWRSDLSRALSSCLKLNSSDSIVVNVVSSELRITLSNIIDGLLS